MNAAVTRYGPGAALGAVVVVWWGAAIINASRTIGVAGSLVEAVPLMIKSGTIVVAMHLMWIGWPRVRGRGVHCRRCGYHQEDQGRVVGPCPECGAPWRWIGCFRIGERRGTRWMVTTGLALLLFMGAIEIIGRAAPFLLLHLTPTEILIQRIANLPDEDIALEYDELRGRKPDADRMRWLVGALERKRRRDGYLSFEGQQILFIWSPRELDP